MSVVDGMVAGFAVLVFVSMIGSFVMGLRRGTDPMIPDGDGAPIDGPSKARQREY